MIKAKSFEAGSAKLTQDDVEEIYVELREGTSYNAIAKMFNVSFATIQNVNSGKYFRIPDMRYPIVDRRHKYNEEPKINDDAWDSYIPEPMHTRPVKLRISTPPY